MTTASANRRPNDNTALHEMVIKPCNAAGPQQESMHPFGIGAGVVARRKT
jgi:hypothetical protein